MNKLGTTTITGMILSIMLVMALFFGTFNYVSSNYVSANVTMPLGYQNASNDLVVARNNLNASIGDIKSSAQNISEADGNVLAFAVNGYTGIGGTIRLFFNIIDTGIKTFNAILPGLSFLPPWTKILIEMAIVITLVLLVVGAFKGETKT